AGDTTALAALAVTTSKIANDADTSTKIADNAITGPQITNDAIGSEPIGPGAIDNEHPATGIVSTDKLPNGAVTPAQIADDAITHDKTAFFPNMPNGLVIGVARVNSTGAVGVDYLPSGWTISRITTGLYKVVHPAGFVPLFVNASNRDNDG